jgi:hypothetical protein
MLNAYEVFQEAMVEAICEAGDKGIVSPVIPLSSLVIYVNSLNRVVDLRNRNITYQGGKDVQLPKFPEATEAQ